MQPFSILCLARVVTPLASQWLLHTLGVQAIHPLVAHARALMREVTRLFYVSDRKRSLTGAPPPTPTAYGAPQPLTEGGPRAIP